MQQSLPGSLNVTSELATSSFLDSIARRAVHRLLDKLKVGRLVLEEKGGTVKHFGDRTSELHVKIDIVDPRVYRWVLFRGAIGTGEAYMKGWWRVDNLTNLVSLMLKNHTYVNNMESGWSGMAKFLLSVKDRLRVNSLAGARQNIAKHYDLSNDFFSLFLDKYMQYSSAVYFNEEETLEQGSKNKLDVICDSLCLTSADHLLEIGTGWGGLAIYIAKKTGCKVTTTTISKEQYTYALEKVKREGLEDKISVLNQDYRELSGQFSKIVSIEMIEAIGHRQYREYFKQCERLVSPGGKILVQAITTTDQRFEKEKDKTDFIRTYIFPGGCLPSNRALNTAFAEHTSLNLIALRDLTADYARTLRNWKERFMAELPSVKRLGFDDEFVRMWEFYLCYCEGGFKERVIHTSQFLYEKPSINM